MFEQYIQQLHPLPRFNLQWYKGEDLYSDGDIEDVMVQMIADNPPEDYVEAIAEKYTWPTFYHLTHLRKNILNWYPFRSDAEVLEIGCGLGAITSVLCDRCKQVTAVELSKRRATATLLRCRERENLEIIVGNLNDIVFEKKFDYITLIGVLEYQGSYTDTPDPYCDFLKKIKGLLKPDGKLLIAIENQYGLKYWCGAKEDHSGIPFDGMNQYELTSGKVRTFSKKGLSDLVERSGFKNSFFYYPLPDYKLPTVVYSQEVLPADASLHNMNTYYIPDKTTLLAREEALYKDIIENNVFEFFANSFLVECTDGDEFGECVFASMSTERIPEYRIGTRIMGQERVEKFSLNGEERHLRDTLCNERAIQERGMHVWESVWQDGMLVSKYCKEPLCQDYLLGLYQEKDTQQIFSLFDSLYGEILKSSEQVPEQDNIICELFPETVPHSAAFGPVLQTGYIDMILQNAFLVRGEFYWFDQEWTIENIPAKYILFHAMTEFYASHLDCDCILPLPELAGRYELLDCWGDFKKMKEMFFKTVMDKRHLEEAGVIRGCDKSVCVQTINKLLQ